jgi:hypothetical protein
MVWGFKVMQCILHISGIYTIKKLYTEMDH